MALRFDGNGRFLTVTGDGAADFYVTQPKRFEDINTGGGNDRILANDNIRTAGRGSGLSKPNPLFLVGDTVDAGSGDDTILSDASFGFLIGGDGDDQIVSNGQPRSDSRELEIYGDDAEVPGTSGHGDDTIVAGILDEFIDGGGGRDEVSYEAAPAAIRAFLSDRVFSLVNSGSGRDTLTRVEDITGSRFADLIDGNGAANRFDGGDGNDTINGAGGSDTIVGGAGNDSIRGGASGDLLLGEAGADSIFGDGGDDTIVGGADGDRIAGGSGNDAISADIGDDLVAGGSGNDTVLGGDGADTLFGNSGNDSLLGGSGRDSIDGSSGNDTLDGGGSADTVTGGTGNDLILGGSGGDLLEGESGDDTVGGGNGADTVLGDVGNDNLAGGNNGDRIEGGLGLDSLNGGDGDDTLFPGAGDDTVNGGSGLDLISYSDSSRAVFINLAQGFARIDLPGNRIELDQISDVENANGSSFDDFIFGDDDVNMLRGLRGNDAISGLDGNDTIRGANGRDTILGNQGDDSIEGNAHDDFIFGGFGNDTIKAGSGADNVAGGPGSDLLYAGGNANRFVWGPEDLGLQDLDRIINFDTNDAIVISGLFDPATADATVLFGTSQVGDDTFLSIDLSLTPNEVPNAQEIRDFVVLDDFDASTIDLAAWQAAGIIEFV